jgi:hypothetical protein
MKTENLTSVLTGFDFCVLDDPHFLEDSVREELIVPILRGLGYSAAKPYRIIRSKKLLHPFVSIGSATKQINIVPDYLLEVNDRFAWTLEAKAPAEDILNTRHVEQAYSYAIHSEVRVPYYALCNGREFVLYHISKPKPVIQFPLCALALYWENLFALLNPGKVLDVDLSVKKDFGLHLKRLGFHEFSHLYFPDMPITFIGKMSDDHFMIGSCVKPDGGDVYVVTFDFDNRALLQLKDKIPDKAFRILLEPLTDSLKQIQFADAAYYVTVDCRVGDLLAENDDEIFLPLWVNSFLQCTE